MPGWERWVRRMHDREMKVYVTGSNSSLLGSEISTALAGRKREHEVFPFSFPEFLEVRGAEGSHSDQLVRMMEEYLTNGGFPYPTVHDDPSILADYRRDIIERDVLLRHRIADPVRFKELVRFIMSNPGVYLSSKSVKGFLNISHPTLRRYLGYLEDAYAVIALEKFSHSQKVRTLNPRKIYPIDNGLLIRRRDRGHLLESCVVQHLRRTTRELFYWKDERGRELDVYLPEDNIAVQVVYDLDEENIDREERPLATT
jgi:predicted AAA+ superfamily ATPase